MPIIRFAQNKKPDFEVEKGANLMQSLIGKGIPVASSCHGEGVCSKCRLRVVKGLENLSPASDLEVSLAKKNNLAVDERISCQAQVLDDITVTTGYW